MPVTRRVFVCQLIAGAQDPVFFSDARLVTLTATVRDANGKLVPDLTKEDFTLSEDGNPVRIRYFSREADLPLTIGLLIDTSRSQLLILERERRGAYAFLERVLRPDRDRAFVMKFDSEVAMLCPPTAHLPELSEALSNADLRLRNKPKVYRKEPRREDFQGGTKLLDAVLRASGAIMANVQGRKALLLLTDGVDEGSRATLEQAGETAQRSDTLVYSILYVDPKGHVGRKKDPVTGWPMPVVNRGRPTLNQLAKQTGGGAFAVSAGFPLEKILDRIQEELRTQYSIGFIPADAGPGEYRRLSLRTIRPELIVQSRDGYFSR